MEKQEKDMFGVSVLRHSHENPQRLGSSRDQYILVRPTRRTHTAVAKNKKRSKQRKKALRMMHVTDQIR